MMKIPRISRHSVTIALFVSILALNAFIGGAALLSRGMGSETHWRELAVGFIVLTILFILYLTDAYRREAATSGERLRTIVSNLPVIVYALDREGRYTVREGAGLALIGHTQGQAVGRSAFEEYREKPEILSHIREALEGNAAYAEQELADRVFAAYYNPYRGADGKILGITGVLMDVTERRRSQDEVLRLNRNLGVIVAERTAQLNDALTELKHTQKSLILSEKMVALGQLVSGIAHEVNTPLGAIASSARFMLEGVSTQLRPVLEGFADMGDEERALFLDLLRIALEDTVPTDPTDERNRRKEIRKVFAAAGLEESASLAEDLAVIGGEELARRILPLVASGKYTALLAAFCALAQSVKSARIIESAVDQASRVIKALRIFSHRANSKEAKAVDIRNEMEEILTLFRNKLKQGVEISTRFATDSIVLGRSDELSQVWTNLINNALQAMNYKGRLELVTEERGDMLAVSVGDTGAGIPKDIRDRIFEPFFTTKGSGEGTGLGLDIARRVVESHEGTIDFESERGHTVFTVLLPRRGDIPN